MGTVTAAAIEKTKMAAGERSPASGREPGDGPTFEVYIDDCTVVPPAQCRTELYIKLSD